MLCGTLYTFCYLENDGNLARINRASGIDNRTHFAGSDAPTPRERAASSVRLGHFRTPQMPQCSPFSATIVICAVNCGIVTDRVMP